LAHLIDHIIYTASSLKEGMDHIESILGVRPKIGGPHPKWGTENARLSLGQCYLEVVAPDPSSDILPSVTWIASFLESSPKLSSWVLRTEDIELTKSIAIEADINIGNIQSGNRMEPDGTLLEWQLTDPYTMPYHGTLPFLINWGNSPHPSQNTPVAGNLERLIIEHPENEVIREKLERLGMDLEVKKTNEVRLIAEIRTEHGLVILT